MKISKTIQFSLACVFVCLLSAFTVTFVGCQHASLIPAANPNPLYGTFSEHHDHPDVILVPQWHLSPQMNTKKNNTPVPQTENQLAIFFQLSTWIADGWLRNVVVEGCEGEIHDGFTERFNGWTLQDLKALPSEKLDATNTHVGLKLKAKYGNKIHAICGDNLVLIKKHQLILSDLRGLSGFKIRIAQFKSDKAKRDDYVKTARSILKLPDSSSEQEVTSALDQKLKEKINEFEALIGERNKSFIAAVANLEGQSAIVIGAVHETDLKNKLRQSNISFSVFKPIGLKGDESELIEQTRRLFEQSRSTSLPKETALQAFERILKTAKENIYSKSKEAEFTQDKYNELKSKVSVTGTSSILTATSGGS